MTAKPLMFDCPSCRRLVIVHSDPKRLVRECCRTEAMKRVHRELADYVAAANLSARLSADVQRGTQDPTPEDQ